MAGGPKRLLQSSLFNPWFPFQKLKKRFFPAPARRRASGDMSPTEPQEGQETGTDGSSSVPDTIIAPLFPAIIEEE